MINYSFIKYLSSYSISCITPSVFNLKQVKLMNLILTSTLALSSAIQYPMVATAQTQKPEQAKPNTSQKTTSRVYTPPKASPRIGIVSRRRTGMGSR